MSSRTLWEEGRQPGRLVATTATALTVAVAALDARLTDHVGVLFDLGFVVVVVAAALSVHPRDFFVAGVLPPLLLLGVVLVLALVDRGAVADPADGLVQSVVSGLAHHAKALVTGYAATLGVLAIRQATIRKRRRRNLRKPVMDGTRAGQHTRPAGAGPKGRA